MSTYPSLYKSLPSDLAHGVTSVPVLPVPRLRRAIVAMALCHYLEVAKKPIDIDKLPYGMVYEDHVLKIDLSSLPEEVLSKVGELVRMNAT